MEGNKDLQANTTLTLNYCLFLYYPIPRSYLHSLKLIKHILSYLLYSNRTDQLSEKII